ncbi:MAG: hypothetical protein FD187_1771 [bacterium]|nr:MAG: hypothetical protein FD142_728 [bacterium]KAF0148725.1 MAG: hypothetical protein FD187_1771 [bacterium]KAF0168215.1 MAG: hypothetical protein FD158_1608 [bacterium]
MHTTATRHHQQGLAACWAIFNATSDPMRAFWNLHLDYPDRRFFLNAAALPEYLEGRGWDELKSEQQKAIKATAARLKRWMRDLEERGL